MSSTPVVSTPKPKKKGEVDKGVDRATVSRIEISEKQYDIYFVLTQKYMSQSQVAKELNISRQAVNKHIKKLEILGLIKPIDSRANPKFYKPTHITPVVSTHATPVVSTPAKQPERRVGKTPILVRDRKSGKIKGWKMPRGEGFKRDYDTVVSRGGERIPMLRVHSIAFSCSIVREPVVDVPWERKGGPNGMDVFVYRHHFSNKGCELDVLRDLDVTFVRQRTGTYDELVIYLPEKFLMEHELRAGERILKDYVWTARKWFQNRFKVWLGLALPYREMEIAREIFDPRLRRFVADHGMLKTRTLRGYGMVDESKRGYPEREFTTIEEVEVDLHMPERVLNLEERLNHMVEVQERLMVNMERFFELMGASKAVDGLREQEGIDRGIA